MTNTHQHFDEGHIVSLDISYEHLMNRFQNREISLSKKILNEQGMLNTMQRKKNKSKHSDLMLNNCGEIESYQYKVTKTLQRIAHYKSIQSQTWIQKSIIKWLASRGRDTFSPEDIEKISELSRCRFDSRKKAKREQMCIKNDTLVRLKNMLSGAL